jgi:broad specificity phosphatase PhoE
MSQDYRLLYLIRHGATEANLSRPYVLQGRRTDLPLSEIGRHQAEAARRALQDRPIARFFCSPLRRTVETAEIVAQPHGKPLQKAEGLIECDVGRWEGLSWEAVSQQDREHWQAFEADPGMVPYAGGESFYDVQCRAVPAIEQLVREHPTGDLAIVTHNIVARVYAAHLLGLPISKARYIRNDNCGISLIAVNTDKTKLLTLNSVLHLDGLLFE